MSSFGPYGTVPGGQRPMTAADGTSPTNPRSPLAGGRIWGVPLKAVGHSIRYAGQGTYRPTPALLPPAVAHVGQIPGGGAKSFGPTMVNPGLGPKASGGAPIHAVAQDRALVEAQARAMGAVKQAPGQSATVQGREALAQRIAQQMLAQRLKG